MIGAVMTIRGPGACRRAPLTRAPRHPTPVRSVGRTAAWGNAERSPREESPGSMDMRCRITSGGSNSRESATESKPPSPTLPSPACGGGIKGGAARVKRCGKSAPRFRQRKRHGKPHREQDRIGAAREQSRDLCPGPAVRVGCWRRRATGVPEEWPSRAASKSAFTRVLCKPRPTEPGLQAG